MTPEEFRSLGHRVVDWVARYMERVDGLPVRAQVEPGEIAAMLPSEAPETPESWDEILADLDRVILPGVTHWQSPSFFAYFPCNASGASILGELVSAGLGVQGMLWSTSPACTELETVTLDWLAKLIGLPESFMSSADNAGGVIQGTASEAALVAMVAARRRAFHRVDDRPPSPSGRGAGRGGDGTNITEAQQSFDPSASARIDGESDSLRASPHPTRLRRPTLSQREREEAPVIENDSLVAYASEQAHSSIQKAADIMGLAPGALRMIPTDTGLRMDPALLKRAMDEDIAAGKRPFFVAVTLGTTSTGAFDPLGEIGPIARDAGCWLHVDAAWAGSAFVCPEFRDPLAGVEHADTFNFNPHKWLLTSFDCSALWTRDRSSLIEAMSVTPEYLSNTATEAGAVIDYRDWQIPLGRRFRAIKLWFVLRSFGAEGLRAHIRNHVELAEWFEGRVNEDDRFEMASPRSLALVCFWLADDPEGGRTKALLERINASGELFCSHTTIADSETGEMRCAIRFAIGAVGTQAEHVERAWGVIRELAASV